MKYLILLVLAFPLCTTLTAQSGVAVQHKHQLGLHAGTTTGVGLSYRYWPGKLGIQVTLLPYKNDGDWNDNVDEHIINRFAGLEIPRGQFVSIGFTGLLRIKQFGRSAMLGYFGNHLLMLENNNSYSTGIGIGFAYEAPVSFNLMLGYGAYDITNSLVLFPAAEIGLYYRFKSKE